MHNAHTLCMFHTCFISLRRLWPSYYDCLVGKVFDDCDTVSRALIIGIDSAMRNEYCSILVPHGRCMTHPDVCHHFFMYDLTRYAYKVVSFTSFCSLYMSFGSCIPLSVDTHATHSCTFFHQSFTRTGRRACDSRCSGTESASVVTTS